MVLSYLAVSRGWLLAEPLLLESDADIAGASGRPSRTTSTVLVCGRRSTRLICCGDHGRPLSARREDPAPQAGRRGPTDSDARGRAGTQAQAAEARRPIRPLRGPRS